MAGLELWGGHECTVNRVKDGYFDQTLRSGHQDRPGDLDLFAELGVKALRYPVLWERTAPEAPDRCDFSWSDERLCRLGALGMRPIVGLLHHGSGPRYTSLLDPGFAQRLADFARRVAERYPWVDDWTPVNEPLTTARFSALYGHWYPHRRDERSFWQALLNQVEATALAMAQIRQVIPAARLVQTEDLGRTYSTPAVAHQAEFDNHRRWMSWDLLFGRVGPDHPLWERLTRFGLAEQLKRLRGAPCPPDIVGINHYLTSDRFLDHRLAAYPSRAQGGNAFVRFADVEAIRVLQPGPAGLEGAVEEAWERYGAPIALTEVHNGCTREEQVRWFARAWEAAARLRRGGVDVRAVTAWSLLGAYDWDSLLTRDAGRYEPGVFDLRGGAPRRTALAQAIKAIGAGEGAPESCRGPGWWERDIRFTYGPVARSFDPHRSHRRLEGHDHGSPLLIIGGRGLIGEALARACEWRGLAYVAPKRAELQLDDRSSLAGCLKRYRPWAVINAAAWPGAAPTRAMSAPIGSETDQIVDLARVCGEADLPLVGFSCASVFGRGGGPFIESDLPAPACDLGRARLDMERVLLSHGRALVVRSGGVFAVSTRPHPVGEAVRRLVGGQRVAASGHRPISATYAPDLADTVLDLLIDGATGLRHLVNDGALEPADFLSRLALALGFDPRLVKWADPVNTPWTPTKHAALATSHGRLMPSLDDAILRYAQTMKPHLDAGLDLAASRPEPARSSLTKEI